MLKKHCKIMFFFVLFIETLLISSNDSSNIHNQIVPCQLDLRPSDRYSGVSYDVNRRETPEERARYYQAVSIIYDYRIHNNNITSQATYMLTPASSLSVIQEDEEMDSCDSNDNSEDTNEWFNNINVSVFDRNNTELSIDIAMIRKSSSIDSFFKSSNGSVHASEIHDLQDYDFAIGLNALPFYRQYSDDNVDSKGIHELSEADFCLNSLRFELLQESVPYNTPISNSSYEVSSNNDCA